MKLKNIMAFVMISFFYFSFYSSTVFAGPARAKWVDSTHLNLKFTDGLRLFNEMRFFLSEQAPVSQKLVTDGSSFELPLLNHTDTHVTLSTAGLNRDMIENVIRKPFKVYVTNAQGQILDSTAIQYAGVLDQLFAYTGNDLGATRKNSEYVLKLWAPTATEVKVRLYKNGQDDRNTPLEILSLQRQQNVWTVSLPESYQNHYYLYEVTVFQPYVDRIETSLVTDPYSFSLSVNGTKSQLIDINDPAAKPQGWDQLHKPPLGSVKDTSIYELQLRDYTIADDSMPVMYRGTYMAFTQEHTKSMRHLKDLAQSGLTHVHVMPFNDFGSINEDKKQWQNYTDSSPNLEEAQNIIGRIRTQDPYNWGYDPVHYFAPEGSYALEPEGLSRIRETRAMVQGLNNLGLRTIQDVVFNHTYRHALEDYSVFDKIVPLYYYRLTENGDVFTTSCCADTASENLMMEKLLVDAVVFWAKTYKLDGFRFDLMSFHTHDTMIKVRESLRSLTLSKDGVDGSKIVIFGEGWAFGSLFYISPNTSANLLNSYGLGIGFFNDRLRDAVRGGTTNSAEKSDQGFATGLFYDFNYEPANRNTPVDLNAQKEKLLHLGDVIKSGLAGNLRDFALRDFRGVNVKAGDINFRGAPLAASAQGIETINYVSAHDGYTLWDAVQAKAPFYTPNRNPMMASPAEKQRMHQLALAIPLLSQGIPFIEAGTELLRSKSGDQDSYDSGDFFNKILWTGTDNNWGNGLPPIWKNYNDWAFWRPRLADPQMKVSDDLVAATKNYVSALLRLRRQESLFKMNSLNEISRQLSFIDNDVQPEAGLIAMHLQNGKNALLVLINGDRNQRGFNHQLLQERWEIHPLLDEKVDPVLSQVILSTKDQTIQIPGRTVVVLRKQ